LKLETFYAETPKAPLQKIEDEITKSCGVILYIKRLDLLHPALNGNKYYKLKYNLLEAERLGINKILTFGGAFSNHIYATAAAGKLFGFETFGIIRGDELNENSSNTLQFVKECGMKLQFVCRTEYREKEKISSKFKDYYIIPEGGTNELALKGIEELTQEIIDEIGFCPIITTAVGTGGTLAGIVKKTKLENLPIGIPVLKNASFLSKELRNLLEIDDISKNSIYNWDMFLDFHFGGYGKVNSELIEFIYWFEKTHNISLEQVYTGKLLCGLYTLIKQNWFPKNSTIVALHTGGLQGRNYEILN
jgi:1-aminocyclopropane-1-carboxylate deaminase